MTRAAKGPTAAQRDALARMNRAPLAPGMFSGWGPYGHRTSPRIHVRTATADALIRDALAEVRDGHLCITEAGKTALSQDDAACP